MDGRKEITLDKTKISHVIRFFSGSKNNVIKNKNDG